ncbi:MAG: carboxypeptidase regulatory-like domain-containing protein [Planctomycetes bacterium]|nr:carboxypeptidase regulatory-like domain-containing protein [Planctomycetota bacterium]
MKSPFVLLFSLFAVFGLALAGWRWSGGDATASPQAAVDTDEDAAEPVFLDEPIAEPDLAAPSVASEGEVSDIERAEAAVTPPPPAPKAATKLRGRVVDSSALPVEGARVYAALTAQGPSLPLEADMWGESWRKRREARTDADGRFLIEDAAVGVTRLAVRASAAAPLDVDSVVVVESVDTDVGELVLQLGVRLVGNVVDASGAPVAGAVLLRPFDSRSPSFGERAGDTGIVLGESDELGRFDLRGLAPGPWVVLAHHAGFPDAVARGEDSASGEVVQGVRIELAAAAWLRGAVRVPSGARTPAFDAFSVQASYTGSQERAPGEPDNNWRRVRCRADGSFELGGLRKDEPYRVSVVWHRTKDDSGGTEVAGSTRDILTDGSRVDFELQPFSVLLYRPCDALTGAPVSGLDGKLVARSEGGRDSSLLSTTRDDGDGVWSETSAQLPKSGESVSLVVTHEAYRPTRVTPVALAAASTTDAGRVSMEPLGELRVRVLSADTGEPIGGARVMAELRTGDDGSRTNEQLATNPPRPLEQVRVRSRESDAQGYATLYASLGATGLACATHRDWPASELVEVRFGPRGGEALALYINPGAEARVRVIDEKGAPVAGVAVNATWRVPDLGLPAESMRSGWRIQLTGAEGVAKFARLTPGSTVFSLLEDRVGGPRSPNERDATKLTVNVSPAQSAEITLVATSRGDVRGRVLDAGRPLAGATILLQPSGGGQGRWNNVREVIVRSDAQGRYSVQRLGAGLWDVTVNHATRLVPDKERFDFDGTDREHDFLLSGSAITGSVRDARGRAIEGARIALGEVRRDARNSEQGNWNSLGGNTRIVTDALGNYALRGVPHGLELQVAADHPDYQGARCAPFQLVADELKAGVDFTLKQGAILLVEVEANDGRVVRAQVTAQRVADEKGKQVRNGPRSARLDGRSRARFTGFAGGRYRVALDRAFPGEDQPASALVELKEGREGTVRLRVP